MEQGNLLARIALLAWLPLIIGLFAVLPPRRAVIYGTLIAWLFLPMMQIDLHPFTAYNKSTAAGVGVLLAALIFDSKTLFAFRPHLLDLPMFAWCACPFFSSWTNGLGAYDGITSVVYQTMDWGLPYLVGRLYFSDLEGLRELARGIVIGGLLYVPLCWFEIRMSPKLHETLYGFAQHAYAQTHRYGGWRPMVFMQHGLAVAMWMAAATLCCFAFMCWGPVKRVMGMPMYGAFIALFITTVFCKSVGALGLLMAGLGVLCMVRWTRWPIWPALLALLPMVYMYVRAKDLWSGQEAVQIVQRYSPRAADSLEVRLLNEREFVRTAMQQPMFGWAGWNRFRPHDENGNAIGVPDAMWIIALGHFGLVGLVAFTSILTLPILVLMWRIPVRYWTHPGAAPAAALAVLLALYMCDNLMNAMANPIFVLCMGGLMGMTFSLRSTPAHGTVFAAPPAAAPRLPGPRAASPTGAAV